MKQNTEFHTTKIEILRGKSMTKKETIYNALGMIEGAVCVSQKNTRDVLMKAIDMIKNAIEEDTEPITETKSEDKCDCDHKWEFRERYEFVDSFGKPIRRAKYRCEYCGKFDVRDI